MWFEKIKLFSVIRNFVDQLQKVNKHIRGIRKIVDEGKIDTSNINK
jgi:hypothetical protein